MSFDKRLIFSNIIIRKELGISCTSFSMHMMINGAKSPYRGTKDICNRGDLSRSSGCGAYNSMWNDGSLMEISFRSIRINIYIYITSCAYVKFRWCIGPPSQRRDCSTPCAILWQHSVLGLETEKERDRICDTQRELTWVEIMIEVGRWQVPLENQTH